MTEVLLDTTLNEEQREYLTLVQGSSESLLTIINDILDVSKIEAGKLLLEIRDLDLRDVVLDTVKGMKVSADAKGLVVVCRRGAGCARTGARRCWTAAAGSDQSDRKRNQIHGPGQVSVAIARSRDSADALQFSVSDTGIGIPAEKQALIFEAFTQVDGSFTRRFGGTGLGLTIASRLVRMMDGRIWVESQEGRGSTFHFIVRMQPVAGAEGSAFVGPAGL